jgi:hypothetical protein
VQQTLLDAHSRWHQLGTENAELAAQGIGQQSGRCDSPVPPG